MDLTTAALRGDEISIHAPRAGGDPDNIKGTLDGMVFQSTPPVRGATYNKSPLLRAWGFQSTPPVRGATVKIRIFIRIFK